MAPRPATVVDVAMAAILPFLCLLTSFRSDQITYSLWGDDDLRWFVGGGEASTGSVEREGGERDSADLTDSARQNL